MGSLDNAINLYKDEESYFDIVCDNCGKVLQIRAKNLREAKYKAEKIECC